MNSYCHLGVIIHIDGNNSERVEKHVGRSRRELNAMSGMGICPGGLDPTVAGKLYWRVCMTTMLYGSEVWLSSGKDIDMMEIAHRQAARRIQWLPEKTKNAAVLATIGWLHVNTEIERKKLMLLGSLLRMPEESLHRNVLIFRYNRIRDCCKPTQKYHGLVKQDLDRYQLKSVVDDWIDGKIWIGKFMWILGWLKMRVFFLEKSTSPKFIECLLGY